MTQPAWPKVRPGMSSDERRQARAALVELYRANADRHARLAQRSITCAEYGRHETCQGEQPRNGGCLCECHDHAVPASPQVTP